MVTATTATLVLRGVKSNRTYNVGMYISDVVGATVRFSANGAAGASSLEWYQGPDEPTHIADISILTGPTVATGFNFTSGGTLIPGSNTLISPNLTTNPARSFPVIGFKPGSLIGAVQF